MCVDPNKPLEFKHIENMFFFLQVHRPGYTNDDWLHEV